MSQENVEIIRRLFDTIDESGWDAAIASAHFHDDAELTFKAGPRAGTHKGRKQVGAVIADLQEDLRVGSPSPWS